MVSGDEVTYDTWQVVSLCHLLTFGDMADYHRGTFHFSEACVRIDTRLVFGVVCGVEHFAYVVIERARAHELALGSDFVCDFRGKIAHLDRMLECTGCHLAHSS